MAAALAACLGISLVAACSPVPDLDEAAAGRFQTRVAAAKEHAAQRDFSAALSELQRLSRDVAAAADDGLVSQQRRTRIDDAIAAVNQDLRAAMEQPRPAPSTVPATDPPDGQDGPPRDDEADEADEESEKELEEADKEAEKREEEAKREAEKRREEAKKDAEKAKEEAEKEQEKGKD